MLCLFVQSHEIKAYLVAMCLCPGNWFGDGKLCENNE